MPIAAEYTINIDGITTDPADTPFESYNFGATANTGPQSSGSGAGKVTFNSFSITRKVDKASPNLFKACITGQLITKVTLKLRSAAQKGTLPSDFMSVVLQDVFISNISEAGNVHGGAVPLEEVGFNFRIFQITVAGVSFGYNLDLGKIT